MGASKTSPLSSGQLTMDIIKIMHCSQKGSGLPRKEIEVITQLLTIHLTTFGCYEGRLANRFICQMYDTPISLVNRETRAENGCLDLN